MTDKISMGKGWLPSDWRKGLIELTIPKDKVEWEIMWRESKTRGKEMIDWEKRIKERRDGQGGVGDSRQSSGDNPLA